MKNDLRLLSQAATVLKQGGIIAYPTEGVFGLGCDPNNETALEKLLALKHRPIDKGLILIASEWQQLQPYLQTLTTTQMQTLMQTWPGPVTWVIPAAQPVSHLITGNHASLAVRITAHPIAASLCQTFNSAIISTSANLNGQLPCVDAEEVQQIFGDKIEMIIPGEVNKQAGPTTIFDLISGKKLR